MSDYLLTITYNYKYYLAQLNKQINISNIKKKNTVYFSTNEQRVLPSSVLAAHCYIHHFRTQTAFGSNDFMKMLRFQCKGKIESRKPYLGRLR